ncbi:protein ORF110 [Lake sturgeon herpesvirus]|nr:protein ORF110 [Lake sturgeon herpesvirus]
MVLFIWCSEDKKVKLNWFEASFFLKWRLDRRSCLNIRPDSGLNTIKRPAMMVLNLILAAMTAAVTTAPASVTTAVNVISLINGSAVLNCSFDIPTVLSRSCFTFNWTIDDHKPYGLRYSFKPPLTTGSGGCQNISQLTVSNLTTSDHQSVYTCNVSSIDVYVKTVQLTIFIIGKNHFN